MALTWVVLVVAMQVDAVDAGLAPEAEVDAGVPASVQPVVAVNPTPAVAPAVPVAVVPTPAATRLKNGFGVGFFGATQRSEVIGSATGVPVLATVSTPFIGVRWWTPLALGPSGRLGVEVAGGISIFTGESENANGLMIETRQSSTRRGFGLHVAVPFALASAEHVIVSVAPEFRYVANDSVSTATSPLVEPVPPRTPGTISTDLALRGGVELFFGFVGLPNLSLELTMRLSLRWAETRAIGFNNSLSLFRSFAFTSTLGEDPLAMLLSSLSAKYYF